MKKNLLLLLLSVFSFSVYAQDADAEFYSYYNNVVKNEAGRLSPEQVKRIKELKRQAGREFEAIGKDRSLTGYEKGAKKREVKERLNREINKIVSNGQIAVIGKHDNDRYDGYSAELARIEARIEAIEAQLDANNDNDYISKAERKARKAALKAEKDRLKAERDIIKQRKKVK